MKRALKLAAQPVKMEDDPKRRWHGVVPTVEDRLKQIQAIVVLLQNALPEIVKDVDDYVLVDTLKEALQEASDGVFWIRNTRSEAVLEAPAPTDDQRNCFEKARKEA